MNRISAFALLVACLLYGPSFAHSQGLDKAPAPVRQEALQTPAHPKADQSPPARAIDGSGHPAPAKSAPGPEAKPRGALTQLGKRLLFRLDRPVTRMEIYSGKRRLGRHGGGLQFDLTPYLGKARGGKLILRYTDASGTVYQEEVDTVGQPALVKPAHPKVSAPQPGPGTPQPGPPNIGTLLFNAPKAGDFMVQGTDFQIKLQGQGYIPEPCYGIYLYQGGNQVMHVVLQRCGPTYTWHVPSTVAGSDFRLRVVTLDSNIMAESAPFAILSSAPDLSVSNLTIAPASPDTADTITFRARVANAGQTRADGVRAIVTLTAPDNTATTYNVTLPGMALGDHHLVQKSFRLPKAGQYTVSLTAEVTLSSALETRLDNNTATLALPVTGLPDLRVCLHQIRNVRIDHWEYINVLVENVGEATSSATTLNIWIDGRGTESVHVPGLIPGSHNLGHRYEMWISRNPSRDYTAVVDPDDTVREGNEDNNRLTGVIVKHLTSHNDTNYRCAGFPINGYPVYDVP